MAKDKIKKVKDTVSKKKQEKVVRPVQTTQNQPPVRKRGIMRSFFSHIIVAALAVVAVGGYFHWEDILSGVGSRVCRYEVLGRYGSSTPVALAISADKSAGGMSVSEKKTATDKVPDPIAAPTGSVGRPAEKSMQAALQDARKAYWEGNNDKAEASFLLLIRRFPDNPDIKSEFGNILYKTGKQNKAVAQYYDAGLIWAKTGKHDRAENIVNLLRNIDPAKSERLRQVLVSAG